MAARRNAPDSGVFALTGASVEALRSVPLFLFAVGALLTWRIGVRTVGEPYARFGAGAFWVWSGYVVWKSTRAHGFDGAALVLGLAVVLLALRLEERPTRRELLLLGLASGSAGGRHLRCCHCAPSGRLARLAAARSAPVRVAGARRRSRRFAPVARLERHARLVLAEHAASQGLFVRQRPQPPRFDASDRVGARPPFTLEWVGGAVVGACLYGALLAAIVWTLVRRRTELGPLVPVLAAFPAFYALSPYSWLNTEPRYLILLGPLLALLVVAAVGGRP